MHMIILSSTVVVVGLGAWAASTTQPRLDMNARELNAQIDVQRIVDYSVVFD